MGRKDFNVDTHEQSKAIIKDLVKQVPYSTIARKYNVTVMSLKRYAEQKLIPSIAHQQLIDTKDSNQFFMQRVSDLTGYVTKLLAACDDWLSDPELPDRYTLKDRAEEITVCYTTQEDTGREDRDGFTIYKTVRHSSNLQEMIHTVLDKGCRLNQSPELQYVHTSRTDNRRLLLDAVHTMREVLEFSAKITGDMADISVSVDVNGVIIPALVQVVVQATQEVPEVQRAVVQGINDIMLQHNGGLLK